jgi:hypothetical protein
VTGLLAAGVGSDWSPDGTLLTFLFPLCLFIVVGALLSILYSRPHRIPGHSDLAPTSATARPMTAPVEAAALGTSGAEPTGREDKASSTVSPPDDAAE